MARRINPNLFSTKEEFEYWLFYQEDIIEDFLDFLSEEISRELNYAPSSLDVLESWLLNRYSSTQAMLKFGEAEVVDAATCYVGEVFRRTFDGYWEVILDDPDDAYYRRAVLKDKANNQVQCCPLSLVTALADRRTGNYLRTILENKIRRLNIQPVQNIAKFGEIREDAGAKGKRLCAGERTDEPGSDELFMKETGGKEVDRNGLLWKTLRNIETSERFPDLQDQFQDDLNGGGVSKTVVEQPRDAKDNVLASPVGSAPKTPGHTGHGTPEKVETGTKPFGEGVQPKTPDNTAHDGNEKAAVTNVFESSGQFRGPASKGFDWDHITDRHAPWGEIAKQRLKDRPGYLKSVYEGMTEQEIRSLVEHAWKNRAWYKMQDPYPGEQGRIKYRSYDSETGYTIEIIQNQETGIIENCISNQERQT